MNINLSRRSSIDELISALEKNIVEEKPMSNELFTLVSCIAFNDNIMNYLNYLRSPLIEED